ncbi:MAG: LysR substrate-binding domain-containing protein [Pseudomonadota bacterium]|uniref:LysR substrate-binding domain-containing protein n=1 Tax=Phenylobacterium sp. TaxID=1871053 RepID=UPI0025F6E5DD|nr:LysR substrate-binding domain-containing protein [Phenylobacterium sp.]MBT9471125.1 LysR family transcriptional regulator [Phenylobacterium sp.]
MLKLNQVRDFVAVAKHGSLRAASREISVAQPSLTKSIQSLEEELGAPLFERSARGTVLTPSGAAFLPRAQLVMEELRRGKEVVAQLNAGVGGRVAIGLSPAATLMFLSSTLRMFRRRYSELEMRITDGRADLTMPLLRNGELDFVVGPVPPDGYPEEVVVEKLFVSRRAVTCRRGHPLAGARALSELLEQDWISTAVSGRMRTEFDAVFTERGLPRPQSVVHCENTLAALELLINSDMVALLPRPFAESAFLRDMLTFVPLEEAFAGPDIHLIRRAGLPLTPAADHLAMQIRRAADNYNRAHS